MLKIDYKKQLKHLYNPYKKEVNITDVSKMYIGPFSEEGLPIKRIHTFIQENGYEIIGKHHEIYLSDPGRTVPEKLKTIIRQPIKRLT